MNDTVDANATERPLCQPSPVSSADVTLNVVALSTSSVQPLKPEPPLNGASQAPPTSTWQDWPFALLFLVHVFAVFITFCSLGLPLLSSASSTQSTNTTAATTEHDGSFTGANLKTIMGVAMLLALVAAVVAMALLKVAVAHASRVILWSLQWSIALNVLFAILCAASGLILMAILFVVFGLLAVCYFCRVRHRIPFAAANLQVATSAIKHHWSIFPVAFGLMGVQIVWVFIWAIALVGIVHKKAPPAADGLGGLGATCMTNSNCQSNLCGPATPSAAAMTCQLHTAPGDAVAYFFMLVSFYWGVTVVKNVLHVTVAGTVASWWAAGNASDVTAGAFRRATTTSFGSICLGSLLVAVLQALETLAREARQQGDWVACVAECILSCARRLLEYVNRWAFVYVGIYGFKFTHAGKSVFTLFNTRGLSAIVNDDLIGHCLGLVSLSCGLICAILGLLYTCVDKTHTAFPDASVLFAVVGLAFGIGVSMIPLGVVDSAVATIFVCFAEDPAAFARAHPELHETIVAAWREAYPDVMTAFSPTVPSTHSPA
ncbi:Aste57867_22104 [Aphanomyces stellatus]|uniref:Choline transporter-like protein n=1 Tax=Aphanomyces stellatus TaxID=120398 RepID=A0A485LJK1_9STRA|nr:hypothetical protein As57867_022035 [Aphanomyces stellatus]VFT98772.1 Aste57867_22104 [Aphanomyces stellatus]